ncbi:MAG TPA: DNA polymerase Y family protein, partial [Polyangiaceae bacterium]
CVLGSRGIAFVNLSLGAVCRIQGLASKPRCDEPDKSTPQRFKGRPGIVPAQLALELEPKTNERRIACVILPELACELARWAATTPIDGLESLSRYNDTACSAEYKTPRISRKQPPDFTQASPSESAKKKSSTRPFAVILMDGVDRNTTQAELNRSIEPNFRLSAVDVTARRLGIIEGQTIVEARSLHAGLEVVALSRSKIVDTLRRIAESLLDRASIVAIEAPDTIWLEIGPVERALGGEAKVVQDVIERVRCLGHAVRLAVAAGPRLAQLFARWAARGKPQGLIVPIARSQTMVRELPIAALPLTPDQLGWLGRLGLIKFGDLHSFPEGELVSRLGRDSARFIALARGEDNEPLFAIQPERVLREGMEWEEPVEGLDRLRFVLRRLTTNLEARLAARGEAAERLSVSFQHDRGIARHLGVSCETHLHLELTRPLGHAEDLERIIVARCERLQLLAPSIALELKVIAPIPKQPKQLELGRLLAGYGSLVPADEGLPVLLAELEIDIGIERVGLLKLADSHRPEAKSLFVPCRLDETSGKIVKQQRLRKAQRVASPPIDAAATAPANSNGRDNGTSPTLAGITRLLEKPIAIAPPIRVGATVFLEHQAYVIEQLRFEERLEGIEWWNKQPIARDYWRSFLRGTTGGLEALIYVEPQTGHCFLQAVVD